MEDSQTRFVAWVRAHKKQLLLAGISTTAILGIILGLKNRETIIKLWAALESGNEKNRAEIPNVSFATQSPMPPLEEVVNLRSYTSPQEPVFVRLHIRTLPEGKSHSPAKAAEAVAMGIVLPPNQTIVDAYPKYVA